MIRRAIHQLESRYRNHHYALPVLSFLGLIAVTLIIIASLRESAPILSSQRDDSNIVILHVDGQTITVPTREKTVEKLLDNAGVAIQPGDVVEPTLDASIDDDDFRVNVYRAAPVVIHDSDKRIQTVSAAQTSRSIASQVGIEVYPEDEIVTEPSKDFLRDGIGSRVVINRSTPVNLNLYGSTLPIRTRANTVEELLKEKAVVLSPGDNIRPSLDTPVSDGIQIFITRYGTEVISTEEPISMPIEVVEDTSLSFGASVVRQQGSDGRKSVTYELQMENGVEVGRKLIQEVVVQEPVAQVMARGKAFNVSQDKLAVMRAAGIADSDHVYVNYIINKESGWNITARNTSSGAYGLCQSLPGSKMATAGSDWETNPVTQLKWCSGYASGRYGSWSGAYEAWLSKGWW